jgi:hypothetical protein
MRRSHFPLENGTRRRILLLNRTDAVSGLVEDAYFDHVATGLGGGHGAKLMADKGENFVRNPPCY